MFQALALLALRVPQGKRKWKWGELYIMESLILAQNERWRRGLGMQVERSFSFFEA